MPIRSGDRFSATTTLSPEDVSRFAALVGDSNPLHRDATVAAATRFGGLIASGAHASALLMALVANHFSRIGPMVGLGFTFLFRRPTPVSEPLCLEWLVIRSRPTSDDSAQIVELRGRLRAAGGPTTVGAKGTVMVWRASAA